MERADMETKASSLRAHYRQALSSFIRCYITKEPWHFSIMYRVEKNDKTPTPGKGSRSIARRCHSCSALGRTARCKDNKARKDCRRIQDQFLEGVFERGGTARLCRLQHCKFEQEEVLLFDPGEQEDQAIVSVYYSKKAVPNCKPSKEAMVLVQATSVNILERA
jgi:hypothetical protein